ncbi:MAG: phosphodiester glycosidase family protein [Clostridia bacterium]|nr:phosphodiester glycosidase family protein [Clostridia bacterium]
MYRKYVSVFLAALLLAVLAAPALAGETADVSAPIKVPGAPARDERGFLAEAGEFVVRDMENGFWAYLSHTLQVVIRRQHDAKEKIIWFETDIRTTESERMTALFSERNRWQYPRDIARANRAVLAFTDDFHAYRRYHKQVLGIVIRNGEIISAKTKRPTVSGFPKLENMAYFPDGTLKCYNALDHTAQEYLDMGATDVLAFGPILVTDGQLGEHMRETEAEAKKENYYHYREPRMALGMAEPGHYLLVTVTGRLDKTPIPGVSRKLASRGAYLDWVALKMLELGAVEALNLDGGGSVSLCFLGESLNMKYSSSRKTTHLMGFGETEYTE